MTVQHTRQLTAQVQSPRKNGSARRGGEPFGPSSGGEDEAGGSDRCGSPKADASGKAFIAGNAAAWGTAPRKKPSGQPEAFHLRLSSSMKLVNEFICIVLCAVCVLDLLAEWHTTLQHHP